MGANHSDSGGLLDCVQCVQPGDKNAQEDPLAETQATLAEREKADEGRDDDPPVPCQKNRKIEDAYEFDAVEVGSAAFSSFSKAREKGTDNWRSIKAITKSSAVDLEQLRRDIFESPRLQHAHVAKVHEVFEDRRSLYLVMELCVGGELLDRILMDHSLSEARAAQLVQQVLSALGYAHGKGMYHRDLCPENIVFEDTRDNSPLKVYGFGCASRFTPSTVWTNSSGVLYCAPELLGNGVWDETQCAGDIWSAGVIAFVLLCGFAPFQRGASAGPALWRNHVRFKSHEAASFLEMLLQENPEVRPMAAQALQHPWLIRNRKGHDRFSPEHPEVLERLKEFRRETRLRHAENAVLVRQQLENVLLQMKELFTMLDVNRSGTLTTVEVREGLSEADIEVPPELETVLRTAELEQNAVITYTEFISAMMEHSMHQLRRNRANMN